MALVLLVCLSAASFIHTEAARAGSGAGDFRHKTVEITELLVPEYPKVGQDATLTCKFKLGGPEHRLYTVNWWRGSDQFFTYKEDQEDPKHAYTFDGIQVKVDESTAESVVLESVSESTSGWFKCEVMGEGPSFRTAVKNKYMTVVVPPRQVEIHHRGSNHPPKFRSGDAVMLNCTARGSKPKATLAWELNGIPAREHILYEYADSQDKSGHVTSVLGIRWRAPEHFRSGVARVTCRAAVASYEVETTEVVYLDSSGATYNLYASGGSRSPSTLTCLQLVTLTSLHLLLLCLVVRSFL